VSLGSPIQNPSPRFAGLLWHKRHFESVLVVTPPLPRYRSGGNLESFGDPLVGPAIGASEVGFEQDAGVEKLAGMNPTTTDELFEMLTLCIGKTDDVLLVHGETPVLA
jgi:hypothetical protein